ncbi:MAG TPA: hypothetical protein VF933_11720 [Streptosporangiaceae bacterium]
MYVVILGSDGSREMLAVDTRSDPAPVVLIDIRAEGWQDADQASPRGKAPGREHLPRVTFATQPKEVFGFLFEKNSQPGAPYGIEP